MASKTHGERLDRIEAVIQILAEDQVSLRSLIADLATETRRGFDQVAVQFSEVAKRMEETDRRMQETDRRMQETDRRMQETDKRIRDTDGRIDKLVIAIGELIRSRSNN